MSKIVFGDDNQAGGFFVEAVDDTWTELIFGRRAAAGKGLAAAKQRVDQSALRIPCSGMNAHSSGFVDDEQIVVFVEDVERNGLGFGAQRRALTGFDGNAFVAPQLLRGLGGIAVHQNKVSREEFLNSGAGKLGGMLDDPLI